MAKTPQQVAEKWARNYSNSAKDFEDAINALTVSPMEQAIKQGERYIANVRAAYEAKRWEKGLRRVNFDEWKKKTIKLGKSRMAEGAVEAKPKVEKFMDFWMPKMVELRNKIKDMPKTTDADRKARLIAAYEFSKAQKYRDK